MNRSFRLAALPLLLAPALSARAQTTAPDSAAIAAAVAKAIRARIPTTGVNRGANMDQRPSSTLVSAPWNRLVGRAIMDLDSTLVVTPPTTFTTRVNIVSVGVWTDSLSVRVAISACHDTPRGNMFGGTSYDYTFRRSDDKWIFVSDHMRGNGDGRCK